MHPINKYSPTRPPACLVPFLFLAFAAVSTGAAAETNLVLNPSFEQAAADSSLPADWRGDGAVFSRDEGTGRNGSVALKYSNDDPTRYRLANQPVSLKPGRKYRFGGWVKTEKVTGDDSGATFCIEWTDKQGKWLGGVYPSGVKGTEDWTQVTAVAEVPEEAGGCTFSCYLRNGMTGIAWFDDIQLVHVLRPPMHSVLTSPVYRGRITAAGPDTVRAVAQLDLRDWEGEREDLVVRGVLSNASDGTIYSDTELRPASEQETTEPVAIELPAAKLPPGRHELAITLEGKGGKAVQTIRHDLVRLPDDIQFKCEIDKHRRLLLDGQPFFPLGTYWSSIKEDELQQYADSKFNCLMPYGSPNREQMDWAEQYGLKVIYSVKNWYAGSRWCPATIRSVADEEAAVRARIREFRNHPALLAWYLNDELPQRFLPQLKAHQRWAMEEDPDHPTWTVLYQVNEVAAYLDTFDVIGTDPYPIGRKPASMAAQWTAETLRQVGGARPLWQVPQLHSWANYEKVSFDATEARTPTTEEVRSMAWQCITEGATGLVFYSWYDMRRNKDVSFDEQWSGLKRIAAEIDRMAPIILSVEAAPTITVNDGAPPAWLHCILRSHRGKLYLIAANDGDGAGRATFQLPSGQYTIRELSEQRSIESNATGFSDDFDALAVHLYEITPK